MEETVLQLGDKALDLGIDLLSLEEVVISPRMAQAVAEVRARFGLSEERSTASDGCTMRDPRKSEPSYAVVLPARVLRNARSKDERRAALWRHKVIHEFAHCHDLARVHVSRVGREVDEVMRSDLIRPRSAFDIRLALVLQARAEYAACRLSAGYRSSMSDVDARDLLHALRKLYYEPILDRSSGDELMAMGNLRLAVYWFASLSGLEDGGNPSVRRRYEEVLEAFGFRDAFVKFREALRELYDLGYFAWMSMSVFDAAVAAHKEMEGALLDLWASAGMLAHGDLIVRKVF